VLQLSSSQLATLMNHLVWALISPNRMASSKAAPDEKWLPA